MAKVVITFEDDEDGVVDINVQFDPPMKRDTSTPAQNFAVRALAAVTPPEEDIVSVEFE